MGSNTWHCDTLGSIEIVARKKARHQAPKQHNQHLLVGTTVTDELLERLQSLATGFVGIEKIDRSDMKGASLVLIMKEGTREEAAAQITCDYVHRVIRNFNLPRRRRESLDELQAAMAVSSAPTTWGREY